jgi:hypothetical protein
MKIISFVVCDDIRNEAGNKNSFMGVYDDNIIFSVTPDNRNSWPKTIKLGFHARILADNIKPNSFEFNLEYNQKKTLLGKGELHFTEKINKIKIVVLSNFEFKKSGTMKFVFDFFDENNNIVETINPDYELTISESVKGNIIKQ